MKRPKYSKDNVVEFKNGKEDSPFRCIGVIVDICEKDDGYDYTIQCANSSYIVYETSVRSRFIDIESGNE